MSVAISVLTQSTCSPEYCDKGFTLCVSYKINNLFIYRYNNIPKFLTKCAYHSQNSPQKMRTYMYCQFLNNNIYM